MPASCACETAPLPIVNVYCRLCVCGCCHFAQNGIICVAVDMHDNMMHRSERRFTAREREGLWAGGVSLKPNESRSFDLLTRVLFTNGHDPPRMGGIYRGWPIPCPLYYSPHSRPLVLRGARL